MTAIEQMIGRAELGLVDCIRTAAEVATFREMAEAVLNAAGVPALLDVAEAAETYMTLTNWRLTTVHQQPHDARCEVCVSRKLDEALAALRKLPQEGLS